MFLARQLHSAGDANKNCNVNNVSLIIFSS
jgi:hypothetical protein